MSSLTCKTCHHWNEESLLGPFKGKGRCGAISDRPGEALISDQMAKLYTDPNFSCALHPERRRMVEARSAAADIEASVRSLPIEMP